jgi:hypothetical protein
MPSLSFFSSIRALFNHGRGGGEGEGEGEKKGESSCFNSECSNNKNLALVQNLKEATTDSNSKEHDNERTIQWILPAHEFHGIPQGSITNA